MVIKIILGIVAYIVLSFISTILFLYVDRKEYDANSVYKDYYDYVVMGLFFPIILPPTLMSLISDKLQVITIAIVEYLIAKENIDVKDNSHDSEQGEVEDGEEKRQV